MKLNHDEVKKFLPHRKPFLFVDTVADILTTPDFSYNGDRKSLIGCEVVANFKLDHDLEILKGHFPGNPILPGVIQVEMMAQAATMLFSLTLTEVNNVEVALVGIDKARFRAPVVPPCDLVMRSKLTKTRGDMVSYDCSLIQNGKLVSEVSVLASVRIE